MVAGCNPDASRGLGASFQATAGRSVRISLISVPVPIGVTAGSTESSFDEAVTADGTPSRFSTRPRSSSIISSID